MRNVTPVLLPFTTLCNNIRKHAILWYTLLLLVLKVAIRLSLSMIIENDRVISMIIENDRVISMIIENDRVISLIIENDRVISMIIENDRVISMIIENTAKPDAEENHHGETNF